MCRGFIYGCVRESWCVNTLTEWHTDKWPEDQPLSGHRQFQTDRDAFCTAFTDPVQKQGNQPWMTMNIHDRRLRASAQMLGAVTHGETPPANHQSSLKQRIGGVFKTSRIGWSHSLHVYTSYIPCVIVCTSSFKHIQDKVMEFI